jgi:phosphatidylglycerol lysyltransferase
MKTKVSIGSFSSYCKEHINPFVYKNVKIVAQVFFTLFFIGIGIWFIKQEHTEFFQVSDALVAAKPQWVLVGLAVTAIYILLQAQMYVFSFASVRAKVSLSDSIILFIKRNFISVFLPAGGISSLAFFTGKIEDKGIKKTRIHFASSIYGFVGILSVIIVAIPAFIYAILQGTIGSGEWYALGTVVLLTLTLLFVYHSIIKQGVVYKLMLRFIPSTKIFLIDLQRNKIDRKSFLLTVFTSIVIEFAGIAHLYIAMIALGFAPSFFAAVMAYLISIVFLIISPFLRGLGAIEVSMAYVLIRFGFGSVEAISITFLYRFFEFWIPLVVGVFAFLSKLNKILMRVLPALFLLALGIVNIISVLTPAISERLSRLKEFLPVDIINDSNYLVLFSGLFLMITAVFMLKGMRTAWWFAFILTVLSIIGHITKAIDYEEAIVAVVVAVGLIFTRKEYYIKTNPKSRNIGIQTSVLFTFAILIYGIIGFYFLDKKHFNIDFNIWQSVRFTFQNYFLVGSNELIPTDVFAQSFLYSINISGFLSIAFLIYTFVRAYKHKKEITDEDSFLAKKILKSFGNSSVDYFKTYCDKMIFFSDNKEAFIAYRISGNFAVVLENPVAKDKEEMKNCILEFDWYCHKNGLKSIYYRVPESSLEVYHQFRKKALFLGQEGIVDISTFCLEGRSKKSMRNAIKKVTDLCYKSTIHLPPIKDGILQKIKSVSDAWLFETDRNEIIFSQGMFDWNELKQQTIITVENDEEKVVAFLNVIPDYAKDEATYDLIRKTKDAPNGVMDFILIELFNYLKTQNIKYVNLGFAPLSGLDDAHTFSERSMKFAYEKIKSFSAYKGLREYKEKFEPVWSNKYLIYEHDYDLLKVPNILTKVIKP